MASVMAKKKSSKKTKGKELDLNVIFAETQFCYGDLKTTLLNNFNEIGKLDLSSETLTEVGSRIKTQLENDIVERGWESIETLLNEEEIKKLWLKPLEFTEENLRVYFVENEFYEVFLKYKEGDLGYASFFNQKEVDPNISVWDISYFQCHLTHNNSDLNFDKITSYDQFIDKIGECKSTWNQLPISESIDVVIQNIVDWLWAKNNTEVPKNFAIISIENREKILKPLKEWGGFL
jgi:hypothetical protein